MTSAYYYISTSRDPYYNIALEDYLYRQLRSLDTIYLLWINTPSVFMGRYQHPEAELDVEYLRSEGIALLRRTSGGGTVYHDEGNLNFSVIKNGEASVGFDLAACPQPIQSALAKQGVEVVRSPRGDLRLNDLKVGGAAEAMTRGRLLYHICLLFDTDLDVLERILTVSPDTTVRSRVPSIRSRVANLRPVLPAGCTITDLQHLILDELRGTESELTPLILDRDAEEYIQRRRMEHFEHPDWIYSPIGLAKGS